MPVYTQQSRIGSELVYKGEIINLRVDQCRVDGQQVIREVVEHNGGVVILCQPTPDQVVLIRQYRYSVNEELIEVPAGRIEIGEEPAHTARRELTEETGYVAANWSELTRFYTAPGFCNEMLYVFRATDVHMEKKNLDHDEETEVFVPTLDEAWELVKSGKVRDAKTITCISILYAEQSQRRMSACG